MLMKKTFSFEFFALKSDKDDIAEESLLAMRRSKSSPSAPSLPTKYVALPIKLLLFQQ